MKGAADFYESETNYDLDTTAEFSGDATPSAAELEAELILGLAKNFGVGSLDLYGVAERLAGLLEDDDVSEDEDSSADQHHEPQGPSDEVLAGYSGCMHEALRYLMEEEGLPPSHPLVQGLANHLVTQQRLLEHQLASDRPTSE